MSAVLEKVNELPEGWKECALEKVLEVIRGISFKSSEKLLEPGKDTVACLRTANVQENVDWDNLWWVPEDFVKRDKQFIKENDILMSNANSYELVGKVSLVRGVPEKATLGAFITMLRAREGADPKFFFYQLRSHRVVNEIRSRASTTTNISNVSTGKLKDIPLWVAPPKQQKRIVAKIEELFSHIDAGIEALKKAKLLLKQYRQSVLKAAVTGELTKEWREENSVSFDETWQSLELSDVVEIIDPNPSHRYPPYDDGDVPLMATKQMVGDDDWDESTAKLTTTEFYEQRKASHGFKSDDIIFARKGRLGLARRPPQLSRYAFSHTIFIIRGNTDIHSEYLLWVLRREDAISWMLTEMNVAAGVPTLGKAILGKLPLLLPSKKEQKIIAEKIEKKITAILRMTEDIEQQLVKSEKNKQAILASAFKGIL